VKIIINKRAENTLAKVADWIKEQYFLDSATKWLDEFNQAIQETAKAGVKYAICNHPSPIQMSNL